MTLNLVIQFIYSYKVFFFFILENIVNFIIINSYNYEIINSYNYEILNSDQRLETSYLSVKIRFKNYK